MRILLVSQMYPGPAAPDLGTFVRDLELALGVRGHDVELAVLDRRRGGKRRYLELLGRTRRAARAFRPHVVYAHFLVPAGLIALAGRAPLVVTAHGRDVRHVGAIPGIAAATRPVVRRAPPFRWPGTPSVQPPPLPLQCGASVHTSANVPGRVGVRYG